MGLVVPVLLLAAIAAACTGDSARTNQPRGDVALTVVATTTQAKDWVGQVGGGRVRVVPVLEPGADPHEYQPTAADARHFAEADAVFENGLGLEPWADALAKNVRAGVPVVRLAEESHLQILKGPAEDPLGDPHVWQDPTNVQAMVTTISDTLARLDPPGAAGYQERAQAYQAQLTALDQEIQHQIGTIPAASRKLVTNHDAFSYYVRRYGLIFVGSVIPSLSSDAEPSAAEVQQLVDAIKSQHVKAIYTETNLNPRLEQQVAGEAGVKIYANLYGDALGPAGSPGATYLGAMRFNTQQIVEGLR